MRHFRTYAFLDGGYLREIADAGHTAWADPLELARIFCSRTDARSSGAPFTVLDELELHRVVYYDGVPDSESEVERELQEYWQAVELLPDTHLGFGSVKRTPSGRRRQKGVDTLIAVEMLSGAYDRLFDLAILVAGDADFVPVLQEIRRRGIHLVLAADPAHASGELRRVCDRFVPFGAQAIPPLKVDGRVWTRAKTT